MALPGDQIIWIEAAREGDTMAFNKLVEAWYPRIYNYGYKYFSGQQHREPQWDMAQEVAQKTFIRVFEKLGSLQDAQKFRPWLYRIATNCCHEELRKNKFNLFVRLSTLSGRSDKEEYQWEDDGPLPEGKVQIDEQTKAVQKALQALEPKQRLVIIMKEYEGLKFKEIAEILGIPENTAKARLYYGLKHMKKMLEKWNFQEQLRYEP